MPRAASVGAGSEQFCSDLARRICNLCLYRGFASSPSGLVSRRPRDIKRAAFLREGRLSWRALSFVIRACGSWRAAWFGGSIPWAVGWMGMRIRILISAGSLTLVGLLISACANSGGPVSPSAIRSGAPWARDLSEPPPSREPINEAVPQTKAALNAARERALR
jgi:hypothetical protein